MDEKLTEEALNAINLFELRRSENEEINKHIKKAYPDFPPLVQHIDSLTESSFVKLLDAVLAFAGEELASYYLYECDNYDGINSRCVIESDGKEWPLTNIMELSAYIYREKESSKGL